MRFKSVLLCATLILCVAPFAFALEPNFEAGLLQMPVDDGGSPAATLDLTNNSAFIGVLQTAPPPNYTDWTPQGYPEFQNMITNGFHGGDWAGLGVTATWAATHTTTGGGTYALAPYTAGQLKGAPLSYTTFVDIDLTTTPDEALFVKFTYTGDSDGDGTVGGSDLLLILGSIVTQNGGGSVTDSWLAGDYDYDTTIGGTDLLLLAGQIVKQNASGSFPIISGGAGGVQPVPEPSTMLLLVCVFASLVTFRKMWK